MKLIKLKYEDIKFKSPVNKGEEFIMEELFGNDKNQSNLEKWVNCQVEDNLEKIEALINEKKEGELQKTIEGEMVKIEENNKKFLSREKEFLTKMLRFEVAEEMAKLKSLNLANQKMLDEKDKRIKDKEERIIELQKDLKKNNSSFAKIQSTIKRIEEKSNDQKEFFKERLDRVEKKVNSQKKTKTKTKVKARVINDSSVASLSNVSMEDITLLSAIHDAKNEFPNHSEIVRDEVEDLSQEFDSLVEKYKKIENGN